MKDWKELVQTEQAIATYRNCPVYNAIVNNVRSRQAAGQDVDDAIRSLLLDISTSRAAWIEAATKKLRDQCFSRYPFDPVQEYPTVLEVVRKDTP